jgi:uncharacterized damage-inducible protein DinB
MNEISRIVDQLERAYNGNPWYGPPLTSVLEGVTPEKAAARPGGDVHSIWELTEHIIAWEQIALRRIAGEIVKNVPESMNFPLIRETDAVAWQKTVAGLARAHAELVDMVRKLSESQLHENLRGEEYNAYFLLHGVIQHNIYHTGQIVTLKKSLALRT